MREYAVTLTVVAVGAVVIIASYAATWATATVAVFAGQQGVAPTRDIALTGGQLVPLGAALGWLALAGAAGLLATRTWGRRVIGTVVVLAGGGAGASALAFALTGATLIDAAVAAQGLPTSAALAGVESVARSPWWIVAMAGSLAVLVGGALAVVRGPAWPGLSRRYERRPEAASGPMGGVAAWDALDRGEDPTDPRPPAG